MTVERWTDEMLDKLAESVKELRDETKEQGIRFTYYQQASQWVVNLAFGLLATATITTIVTAVYRR
jgi:hypothetical protein